MESADGCGQNGWFKSSWSAGNGSCVEVAFAPDTVAVRDSKDPGGPRLVFGAGAWRDFVDSIRAGEFDGDPPGR